eukprot:m.94991 g.94991  ORF g.94991 m.94991 type:complete len:1619 (+) comp8935_c0_seq1:39-4895(+)
MPKQRQFLEDHSARGAMIGNHGKTGAELDAVRKRNTAYEYLCHLEEAKKWIEACIGEELPVASELEGALRNGLIVAKLGMFFAPEIVTEKKIYDKEQKVYKERGLVFRHTDNINQWLRAMENKKFPEIFYPEITDLYDKKNMPRVIYCVHALSRFLYQLGIAPEMEDLHGVAEFTEEELSAMEQELQKAGVQMPKFGKIGGILAKELGEDVAAMHAAVLKINVALENEDPIEDLLKLMRHPAVQLRNLDSVNGEDYRDTLIAAKMEKALNAPVSSHLSPITDEGDEEEGEKEGGLLLVQEEDLGDESHTDEGDSEKKRKKKVPPPVAPKRKPRKREPSASEAVDIYDTNLTKEEIQRVVNTINKVAEAEKKKKRIESLIQSISEAVDAKNEETMMTSLASNDLELKNVDENNKSFYLSSLTKLQDSLPEDEFFTVQQIQEAIEQANLHADVDAQRAAALESIAKCVAEGNEEELLNLLKAHKDFLDIPAFNEAMIQRYMAALQKADGNVTEDTIKNAISSVNKELDKEAEFHKAIDNVNKCIDEGDEESTVGALLSEILGLDDVDEAGAHQYQIFLEKAKETKGEKLNRDEIQKAINDANYEAEENAKHASALYALNDVVRKDKKPAKTLKQLLHSYMRVENVDANCSERYHAACYKALHAHGWVEDKEIKKWKRYTTDDGKDYYYNKESKDTQWIPPLDVAEKNLTVEEVQELVNICNIEQKRWEDMVASEPQIITLQAYVRGVLERKKYQSRMEYLNSNEDAVVKIQAALKGAKQRKAYKERLGFLNAQEEAVVKIQAAFKGNKARTQYTNLTKGENPPITTVRRFLHLLDQSDVDFAEELERQDLKHKVVLAIRSNHEFDEALNEMDIKIGLLVKNRIELQDVVKQNRELKKARKRGSSQKLTLQYQNAGLKSLTKESRDKLESYQHLLYLIQTEPSLLASLVYLDELIPDWSAKKTSEFLHQTTQLIYNYGSNEREQFLLLKLYMKALQTEIKEKVNAARELITGNPTAIKLVISQYRKQAQENHYFDKIIKELVCSLLDDDNVDLNTEPRDVYKSWIGQQERETGEAWKEDRDVTREKALSYPAVDALVKERVKQLISISQKFLEKIVTSVNDVPFGLRYICHILKEELQEKFPEADEDEIIKVLGNVVYYRFINAAIIAPDAFDVIDAGDSKMTSVQRRNLGSIAKLLQFAASGQSFEGSEELSDLNVFLKDSWEAFKEYFHMLVDVASPGEHFKVDEYTDAVLLTKPIVTCPPYDIYFIHKMLADNLDRMDVDKSVMEKLEEILKDLGPIGTVDEELGAADSVEFNQNKVPMTIVLVNKFEVPEDDTSDTKVLFVRTKKLVVDVIRFQQGKNLFEILTTPASKEMEKEHAKYALKRQTEMKQFSEGKGSDGKSPSISTIQTLEETKKRVLANVDILEGEGLCSKKNNYQNLLNAVAQDIRNQTIYRQQRRAELKKMRAALQDLEVKRKQQAQSMDYYDTYVKECLKQLDKGTTSKRRFTFGQKKKKAEDGQRIGSYSSNAAKLKDKGVIISVDNVGPTQLKTVQIEVKSDEVGVFQVKAKMLGKVLDSETVYFQDLLQKQYENVDTIKLFDMCTVNVNLLIFLINKKFYHK